MAVVSAKLYVDGKEECSFVPTTTTPSSSSSQDSENAGGGGPLKDVLAALPEMRTAINVKLSQLIEKYGKRRMHMHPHMSDTTGL